MIVLALPLLFLVGLSCARDPAPGHTPVTSETVIPSRVLPTPTIPPATATPDAASLIAGLTVGPLPVHEFNPLDSEVDGSWLQAVLSLLLDSEIVREIIWMQNLLPLWKYYQLYGYNRPTADDGPDGYYNYVVEIPRPQDGVPYLPQVSNNDMPWISGISDYTFSASTFSTMGFDPRNVDYAAAGGKQPIVLEAVVGAYDPEITRAGLAECADCLPHEENRHRGYAYYSWGEDFKGDLFIRRAPPAYDYVGRGGRISVQQGRVLWALSTDGIHSLIDAAAGAADSLWDSEDMRLVAQAMADLGAYAVSYTEADMSLATLTPLNEKPRVEFIPPIEYSGESIDRPAGSLAVPGHRFRVGSHLPGQPAACVFGGCAQQRRRGACQRGAAGGATARGSIAIAWDSLHRIDSANRDGDSRCPATGAPGAGARRKVPLGISDARLVSLRNSRMSRRSASRPCNGAMPWIVMPYCFAHATY